LFPGVQASSLEKLIWGASSDLKMTSQAMGLKYAGKMGLIGID